jgi:predicted 3-demethylubiquinone-9 3-methyltransferase (glyoxalase superfamily)
MSIQKITPFLWFNNNGAEAAAFYVSVFNNATIISTNPIVTVFELDGLQLMILNGGDKYKLTEAFSLTISCDTQQEIDYYWNTLTANGGEESNCGWLKDKYGVSWQVVPSILGQLMNNPEKAPKVIEAFMQMKKFDIEKLMNV